MGIPLFIDDKADLSENSFVEMLRSAMDVILRDFSYESVFRYLRSGYTLADASEVDVLDNYLLATGIRGRKPVVREIYKTLPGYGPEDFVILNEIRKKVLSELEPLFVMSRQGTVADYTQALRSFIEGVHGEEQIAAYGENFHDEGDFVREREYAQVYEAVDSLLDKCERILENEKDFLKRIYGNIGGRICGNSGWSDPANPRSGRFGGFKANPSRRCEGRLYFRLQRWGHSDACGRRRPYYRQGERGFDGLSPWNWRRQGSRIIFVKNFIYIRQWQSRRNNLS